MLRRAADELSATIPPGTTANTTRARREQLASIANGRDADLPEVFRRYITEDLLVDPVLAKSGLVLVEAETAKPPANVHSRAPHGNVGYSRSRGGVSSVALDDDIK